MTNSAPLLKTAHGQNFLRVVIGRLTSQFGSQITGFSLTIWIYQQTESLSLFGLLIFLYALPRLVVAPFAGNLVDKYDRKKVMLSSELSALIVIFLLLLLHWQGALTLLVLGFFTIAIASIAVVQVVVLSAATAQLLPPDNRMSGNAIIHIGFAINQMLAPVLAGFLVYRYGLTTVFVIHIILLILAFFTLKGVAFNQIDQQEDQSQSSWQAFKLGLSHVLNKKILLTLALFTLVTNFLLTAAEVLFTPLVLSYETAEMLGRLMAMAGLGIFIGGVAAMKLAKTKRKVHLLLFAQSACGISLILVGSQHSVWLWAVCMVVIFAGIALAATCNQTIWQNRTPLAIQGRVFAVKVMITTSIVPLAYLLSPIITDIGVKSLLLEFPWLGHIAPAGKGQAIGLMFVILGSCLLLFVTIVAMSGRLDRDDETPLKSLKSA
ncbi:MAG: MFS transporter [Algicola sp.]|nr:MFS transporter [Algicola sp.]